MHTKWLRRMRNSQKRNRHVCFRVWRRGRAVWAVMVTKQGKFCRESETWIEYHRMGRTWPCWKNKEGVWEEWSSYWRMEGAEGRTRVSSDWGSRAKGKWISTWRPRISRSILRFYLCSMLIRIKILFKVYFKVTNIDKGKLLEMFEQGSYVIKAEY